MKFINILAVVTLIPVLSHAESRRATLTPGMSFAQVAKLWGPPTEKEDREVKREEIWRYAEGELVFHEGLLVSPVTPIDSEKTATRTNTEQVGSVVEQGTVDQILNEIMKEAPGEDGPGSSASSDSSNTIVPMPGQPIPYAPESITTNNMIPPGGPPLP